MLKLELKKTRVIHCEFLDTGIAPDKDGSTEVKLSVNTRLPDSNDIGNSVLLKLLVEYGTKESFIYISQEILCVFEIIGHEEGSGSDDEYIEKYCLPVAVKAAREYFNSTTKIYNYADIELPIFDFEE